MSSDLPEVLALADRIVVMAEGRTVGELPGDGASEEQVLRLATKYTASVAEVRKRQQEWQRHDDADHATAGARMPNAGARTFSCASCGVWPIRGELTLFVLVIALALVMSIVYPNNFPTALQHARPCCSTLAPIGILVCGMMLLMIAGTFDLSVGSTLALSGVWAGVVAGWWGWPAEVAVLVGILVGALRGLVNGLIVTRIGINALIATLGTLTIYRSLTYVTAGTGVTPITRRLRSLWPGSGSVAPHPVAVLGDAGAWC